jgi:hypothetical protein
MGDSKVLLYLSYKSCQWKNGLAYFGAGLGMKKKSFMTFAPPHSLHFFGGKSFCSSEHSDKFYKTFWEA